MKPVTNNSARILPVLLGLALLASTSCRFATDTDLGAGNSPPPGMDSYFWGSWVRMDGNNDTWRITTKGVTMGNQTEVTPFGMSSTGFGVVGATVTRQSANIVLVNPTNSQVPRYYLFRKAGPTATTTLKVGQNSGRALAPVSGLLVSMQNLTNPGDTQSAKSGPDGTVQFSKVTVNDMFTVTVPVQPGVSRAVSSVLNPSYNGQDLGALTVGESSENFKVAYSVEANPPYLFTGNTYKLSFKVTNIGITDMMSADYSVTLPAGITLVQGSRNNILGTIRAGGGEKTIDLQINVPLFSEYEKLFPIPVRIVSVDGREWDDTVNLKVYREPMTIYVRSAAAEVQGIVISPDRTAQPFRTIGRSGSIKLPLRELPYVLALSGANYNSETKYAVTTFAAPLTDGSELTTSSFNEPNNSETQTSTLDYAQTIMGYLGVYDLDFYQVYGHAAVIVP